MRGTTAKAEINGINLHYRVYGEGEPLLLIMGLGGNADWWEEEFLQPLAERFQVVAFDNRGTGRTDKPQGPYTITLMAGDTVSLMDHLGWPSAHVLGISMGGMIAQELTLDHPQRVDRLVLLCTNCGGREQVLARPEILSVLSSARESITPEEIVKATLQLLFPDKYMEEHPDLMEDFTKRYLMAPTPPHAFMSQLQGIMSWSDYSRLGDLRNPTLVMAGDEDILIPPENSRILAKAIPDSRLVMVPGGGHGFVSQYPGRAAEEILDFLA